jgi:hypothetical protein
MGTTGTTIITTTIITTTTITIGVTGTTSPSGGRAGGEAVRNSGRRPSCIDRAPVLPDG